MHGTYCNRFIEGIRLRRFGILLKKLEIYGIKGRELAFFTSYLQNRIQQVRLFDGTTSENMDIVCGVPQGSVLGPLFFTLYINDMVRSHDLNTISFADDTSLLLSGTNKTILANTINNNLVKMYKWLYK